MLSFNLNITISCFISFKNLLLHSEWLIFPFDVHVECFIFAFDLFCVVLHVLRHYFVARL